jgi:hypothetical protein
MISTGPSFVPQLGALFLVMGLVYFLIAAAMIAIGILALIAWWRLSAAHQALVRSVKELADKLAVPPASTASGREVPAGAGPETSGSNGPQSGE